MCSSLNRRDVLLEAIDHFGAKAQKIKAIEELSELSVELAKDVNNPPYERIDEIVDEIADVYIMLEQLLMILNKKRDFLNGQLKEQIIYKIQRLKNRIDDAEGKRAELNLTEDDVVYISGPMTGLPLFNRHAFNLMEDKLKSSIKCKVLNPARHPDGLHYEDYMTMASKDIIKATAVVLLTDWHNSLGAKREYIEAKMEGLKIFTQKQVDDEINAKQVTSSN